MITAAVVKLGGAPGRLRQRVRAGQRSLLATVGLTAAPALLLFLALAIIRAEAASGGIRVAAVRAALAEVARVFADARDPMETVGALAAIIVAIIFYNARAVLPRPASAEDSEENDEQVATILRTKGVLRVVAVLLGFGCWMLLIATVIQIASSGLTVFGAIEGLALVTLIMLSCNFVTTQREEVAQRSLLALDAAAQAYDDVQDQQTTIRSERAYRSLQPRVACVGVLFLLWFSLSLLLSTRPPTVDGVIILLIVGGVPTFLHWSVLSIAGGLRVPWRRTGLLVALGCALPPLVAAYVSTVGLLVAPPAAPPDLRDQAFFAVTLAYYTATAVTLWPVADIAAHRQTQALKDYLTSRESHSVLERYLRNG